jgi:hypothetical protein
MFSNWKPKLVAFGAFLLAVITWLGFFEISARTLWAQMTAHYVFLAAAIAFTALFFWGLRYWWGSTRVTPENVHIKIREWLDAFNLAHRVMPWEPWHFRYDVTFWDHIIFVGRPKTGARYLHIEMRTFGVRPDHAEAFAALTTFEKRQFDANLALEIARAKISFTRHSPDFSDVSITTLLPITPKLGGMEFLQCPFRGIL